MAAEHMLEFYIPIGILLVSRKKTFEKRVTGFWGGSFSFNCNNSFDARKQGGIWGSHLDRHMFFVYDQFGQGTAEGAGMGRGSSCFCIVFFDEEY